MGTVIVSGTSSTANLVKVLPELDAKGLNVKIIAGVSQDLYRKQPDSYREKILPMRKWMDSMIISNGARRTMHDWICNKVSEEYSLTPDWDNSWRGGGSLETVIEDAHLSPEWILKGIERFVKDREKRLKRLGIVR